MMHIINKNNVSVVKLETSNYPQLPPYNPPEIFPEYILGNITDSDNYVYKSVRESLALLGLDEKNFNRKNWNPFREIIQPGDKVLIKPNLVAESNKRIDDWESVITSGSVIRAVIDFVYLALKGAGEIIVADGPQTDSNISEIRKKIGIDEIIELYKRKENFLIKFIDLRNDYHVEENGIFLKSQKLEGDPLGNVKIDLGMDSFFSEIDHKQTKFYGADYDIQETNQHHCNGVHEYMISKTALSADVFISIPKLKTHKKVGVTLNLKGLVGVNGDKNYLPHYTIGTPDGGGDQFPSKGISSKLENSIVLKAKKMMAKGGKGVKNIAKRLVNVGYFFFGDNEEKIRSGNWFGNDTCWRMVLDLNRIILYYDEQGVRQKKPKRYFSIVDGVIGMEGSGPLSGDPIKSGLIVAGINPVAVDTTCAKLMGFDFNKLKIISRAYDKSEFLMVDFSANLVKVKGNKSFLNGSLKDINCKDLHDFKPHFGWKGKI